jgi:hypothetical protein
VKVLGVVQWTNQDKRGSAIAGVRPLIELQKGEWRPINAAEEFPSQGQVFWPNAQAAVEDSLVIFRAESNAGQKDEFKVVEPKPVYEVLDLRRYGTAAEVRAVLIDGVRLPGPVGTVRALIWCKPDALVGPVELSRVATGTARLVGTNLHRLSMYSGAQVRPVHVDHSERLLRVDDAGPSGYVDWDDDAVVLRRALEAAVRVAKQSGHDPGQTKRQIEDAARALAAQGGPDAQLDRYRLERALSLLENTQAVVRNAGDLAERLREHPAIKAALDEFEAKIRTDVEQSARAELDRGLARERASLRDLVDARARAKLELETSETELRKLKGQLADTRNQIASAAKEAEAAVDARVLAAIDRPLDLLAEVSVLRPFLGNSGASRAAVGTSTSPSSKVDWSRTRGEAVKDKAALRRVLTSVARARGVDPVLLLQVHAAVVARLMPITLGPGALAALTAYAHAVCAGRVLIIHVSPGAIQPHDLDEVPGGGLLAAAAAAKDVDGLSLVVLEGANRAPLEGALVPLLQLTELGLSPLATAGGLRLTASLVAGATTVPVTPQVWSHAAAVYPDPITPSALSTAAGEVALTSDLLLPADEPADVIEALLGAWPDCRELRPAMSRFGSALARLYDDAPRVSDALLQGLVLPYIATALSSEEQAEAVDKAGDPDGAHALALRRLRKRLT